MGDCLANGPSSRGRGATANAAGGPAALLSYLEVGGWPYWIEATALVADGE